jgi:hypothetical protein
MAYISVTNALNNNAATSDITLVGQNFTDIVNGLSDGTKDLNIGVLTCASITQVKTNTIVEDTTAAGVTIDSVLLKDGGITATATTNTLAKRVILQKVLTGQNENTWVSVFRLTRASAASNVDQFGIFGGHVRMAAIQHRANNVPGFSFNAIPIVARGHSANAVTLGVGTGDIATSNYEATISVQGENASTTAIDIQVKVNTATEDRNAGAWIIELDGMSYGTATDREFTATIL